MDTQLLFLESPLCPIAAEVVQHDSTIYFYVYDLDFEEERLITRCACWVKNLKEASDDFDLAGMEEGIAPMMPKAYVREDMDMQPLRTEDLEIVWSKEGHIAGLYHKNALLCVVPSWAVPSQMPGYSKYCKENCLIAWTLQDENAMIPRIEEGREFWAQDFAENWRKYSTMFMDDLYEKHGKAVQCFQLNKDRFPSYFLLVYEQNDICYAFTAGMGMYAMPNTDQYFDDYETKAYGEVAFAWEKGSLNEEEKNLIFSQIAGLANLPWQSIDYIGHGHTIDFHLDEYPFAIFVRNNTLKEHTSYAMEQANIAVNWIVPIREEEFASMQKEKSNQTMMKKIEQDQRYIYRKKGVLS